MIPDEVERKRELLVVMGEVPFLCLINPFLLRLANSPAETSAITSLTKTIQNLSNQLYFGGKEIHTHEQLNPLLAKFMERHKAFVEQYCSLDG